MRILKKILIVLLCFIALVVVVALFLPSAFHFERSMVMKSAPANVFSQVNNLKNWEQWSPWHKLDPNMQLTYEGPEAGVGAKYIWKSQKSNVGSGSLWIIKSMPDSFTENTMAFEGMGESNSSFKIEKVAEGSKVTWAMDSKGEGLPWYMVVPHRIMSKFFMSGMLGPSFDQGLTSLKDIVEKMPAPNTLPEVKVDEITRPEIKALTMHVTCSRDDISKKMGETFPKVMEYAMKHGAKMTGAPFAIFHKWDKEFDFDAGIPVSKKIATGANMKAMEVKEGKYAKVDYYGDYMKIGPTYEAAKKKMDEQNMKPTADAWEEYVTDPSKEKDTAKWHTVIYFPL